MYRIGRCGATSFSLHLPVAWRPASSSLVCQQSVACLVPVRSLPQICSHPGPNRGPDPGARQAVQRSPVRVKVWGSTHEAVSGMSDSVPSSPSAVLTLPVERKMALPLRPRIEPWNTSSPE